MLYLGFLLLLTSTAWAVEESDVTLLFYKYPDYTTAFYNFTLGNSSCNVDDSSIDLSKNISIYIHGWEDVFKDAEYVLMQALVETQPDGLVVRMEYPYEDLYLPSAVATVTPLGTYVANFLLCLNSTKSYSLDKVRVIGHSLGAHIAGAVGDGCGGVLPSVIGLDPAGPSFDEGVGDRLNADDAQLVEAIHTSNIEGTSSSIGTDIFVNNGGVQPGCGSILNVTCNHVAAVTIYAESLYNATLTAVKCSTYLLYSTGSCVDNDSIYVGGLVPDPSGDGTYYVDTD